METEIPSIVGVLKDLTLTAIFMALWAWERADRKYYQHKYEDSLKMMAGLNIPRLQEAFREFEEKPATSPNRASLDKVYPDR